MKNLPQKNLLEKEKLEKVLCSHWMEFLNPRELLNFIRELISPKQIEKFRITRFEITSKGFILWIDTTLTKNKDNVNNNNILFEFFLSNEGNITLLNQI